MRGSEIIKLEESPKLKVYLGYCQHFWSSLVRY